MFQDILFTIIGIPVAMLLFIIILPIFYIGKCLKNFLFRLIIIDFCHTTTTTTNKNINNNNNNKNINNNNNNCHHHNIVDSMDSIWLKEYQNQPCIIHAIMEVEMISIDEIRKWWWKEVVDKKKRK